MFNSNNLKYWSFDEIVFNLLLSGKNIHLKNIILFIISNYESEKIYDKSKKWDKGLQRHEEHTPLGRNKP